MKAIDLAKECGAFIHRDGAVEFTPSKFQAFIERLRVNDAKPDPLTDEQIADMFFAWQKERGTSWADLIRRVERYHGIGGA